jgi:hypothetical protein
MHTAYLIFFLSFPLWASPLRPKIELLPAPESIEDFEHQFKGCPENSECDQVMGMQMQRWKDLVSKIEEQGIQGAKKAQFLELFREKYGIPVEFYTYVKSQQGFKPLFFNSHCKDHNPKDNEEKRVLKGTAFVKSLSDKKATVWRDQTQIEVPVGELFLPQPVLVYFSQIPQVYQLPLSDQPLFIKNKELHVLKEEDGFFYFLKISAKGDWKMEDVDFSLLGQWERKRENVTCPDDKNNTTPTEFGVVFCKSVWDEDQKKPVIIKMHQGCVT